MKISENAKNIIETSAHREQLEEILAYTDQLAEELALDLDEIQWTALVNHLNEMVRRSQTGEKIPAVDVLLFAEVSEDSLGMARKIVARAGNLPEDESYVLSIHFESARMSRQ